MPTFQGFSKPNYTPVPDELFDELLPTLGYAELKVLLYIIRRTFGFKKDTDPISFGQFQTGITTKDGRQLDRGCGIKDRTSLSKALKSLEDKGIIMSDKRVKASGDADTTVYRLRFAEVVGQPYHPSRDTLPPVVGQPDQQETVSQETGKQDIYPSNIRKAQNEDFDLSSPTDSAEHAGAGDSLTHNEGDGYSPTHSTTNGRNIEENEKYKLFARAQKKDYVSAPAEPHRKGGLAHIGQTLHSRRPIAAPTVDAAVARDAIERYIRDTAAKLLDEAPLKSSTSRAFNLYERSGVDLGTFYNLMYDAEKEANRRSATIKKLTNQGFKNRMAYFFAILEDKLGFREKPLSDTAGRP